MRVYFSPEISRLLSTITVLLSITIFGFAVWKAIDLWRDDPTLQQIQDLVEQKQN